MGKNKTYFVHLLRQHRYILALYFICTLLAYPMITGLQVASYSLSGHYGSTYIPTVEVAPIGLAVVMIGGAAIAPYVIFSFLYSKPNMDTYFSMPIKREKLFLLHYVFTLAAVLIPVLLSHGIGYVMLKVFEAGKPTNYQFSSPYSLRYFLLVNLIFILGSLILTVPSLLAILCTTNLFNGLLYGVVLHSLPCVFNAVWAALTERFFGYAGAGVNYYPNAPLIFGGGGPIQELNFHARWAWLIYAVPNGSVLKQRGDFAWTQLLPSVVWFLIGAALVYACLLLFTKHKVGRTNTAFMVPGFYSILISTYGAMLIALILAGTEVFSNMRFDGWTQLIFIFVLAFAIYFVVQIIRHHGIPNFAKVLVSYILIFAFSFGMVYLAKVVIPNQLLRALPDTSRVTAVEVYALDPMRGAESEEDKDHSIYIWRWGTVDIYEKDVLTKPEDMQVALDFQKNAIDRYLLRENQEWLVGTDYKKPLVLLHYLDEKGKLVQARYYEVEDVSQVADLERVLGHRLLLPTNSYYD